MSNNMKGIFVLESKQIKASSSFQRTRILSKIFLFQLILTGCSGQGISGAFQCENEVEKGKVMSEETKTEETKAEETEKDQEIERVFTKEQFVVELRRLADSLEKSAKYDIEVGGEKINVPMETTFSVVHESGEDEVELEYQLKWKK